MQKNNLTKRMDCNGKAGGTEIEIIGQAGDLPAKERKKARAGKSGNRPTVIHDLITPQDILNQQKY